MSKLQHKTVTKEEILDSPDVQPLADFIKELQDLEKTYASCTNVRIDLDSSGYDEPVLSVFSTRLETDAELTIRQATHNRTLARKVKFDRLQKEANVDKLSELKERHAREVKNLEDKINT